MHRPTPQAYEARIANTHLLECNGQMSDYTVTEVEGNKYRFYDTVDALHVSTSIP